MLLILFHYIACVLKTMHVTGLRKRIQVQPTDAVNPVPFHSMHMCKCEKSKKKLHSMCGTNVHVSKSSFPRSKCAPRCCKSFHVHSIGEK